MAAAPSSEAASPDKLAEMGGAAGEPGFGAGAAEVASAASSAAPHAPTSVPAASPQEIGSRRAHVHSAMSSGAAETKMRECSSVVVATPTSQKPKWRPKAQPELTTRPATGADSSRARSAGGVAIASAAAGRTSKSAVA